MSDFGLFVRGENNNLIIDSENPVLAKIYSGPLLATGPLTQYYSWESVRRGKFYYGYSTSPLRLCEVTYPAPITTMEPPVVLATPNLSKPGPSVGRFIPKGAPGQWTGFYVTCNMNSGHGTIIDGYGAPTGWDWVACSFAAPPGTDKYGLRVWDAGERLVFDSGWDVVPFRELMLGWSFQSASVTGNITIFVDTASDYRITYGASTMYGANLYANTGVQINDYLHTYSHPWGHADGQRGILISSLAAIPIAVDNGFSSYHVFYTTPFIGFAGADRTVAVMTVPIGWAQHAGAYPQTFNSYSLMTADISRAF